MANKEKAAVLVASTVLTLLLVRLFFEFDFINQEMWTGLSGRQAIEYTIIGGLTLSATAWASKLLHEKPIMHLSLLRYLPFLRWTANIVLLPLKLYRPLAVMYVLVLTWLLPSLAFMEEFFFRGSITGWMSAVLITLAFGLIHMLMGATLGVSVALVIPGSIFAIVNHYQGLVGAAYLHVFYDIGAIALAVALFIKEGQSRQAAPMARSS